MSQMMPIPKGTVFYVSTGSYSSYFVRGVFKALEEINVGALLEKWLSDHPEQKEFYKFEDRDFLASITHLMEPIEAWEWSLTDYGNANEMCVIDEPF